MSDTVPAAAEERWLPIPDHEGFYEVSDQGRVRSLKRLVRHSGTRRRLAAPRILRPFRNTQTEYFYADLWKNGGRRVIPIHRLVLLAFVGPCPEGMECCHGDGDRTNNCLENLRWDTKRSNQADRLRHGTHNRGERHKSSKLTKAQVLAIRNDSRSCPEIAKDHGIHPTYVSQIKRRVRWAWLEDPAKQG